MNRCGCRERMRCGEGGRAAGGEKGGEDPLSECQEWSEGQRRGDSGIERTEKEAGESRYRVQRREKERERDTTPGVRVDGNA